MGIGALPAGAGTATPSAAPTEATATPSPNPTKDPCITAKSKWQHLQCMQFNSSAPGDDYFGRMKLSYLGIHNVFKDSAISAGAYTTDPRIIGRLIAADDALKDWGKKYPNDPQLARSYFLGEQVWRKVYTQDGQRVAWQYIQTLTHAYAGTYFGKTMTASLAKNGFTEHWLALPQTCPTPQPKGVKPEATPRATPAPTPAPGDPPIDVIASPCVKPMPNQIARVSSHSSASPSPSPKPTKHP